MTLFGGWQATSMVLAGLTLAGCAISVEIDRRGGHGGSAPSSSSSEGSTTTTGASSFCHVSNEFYLEGTVNPDNLCQVCLPGTSASAWSNGADAIACNDGDACTLGDHCTGGVCGGTAHPCVPASCQHKSTCDGNGGCTFTVKAEGVSCPDSVAGPGICHDGSCVHGCLVDGIFYGAVTYASDVHVCKTCDPSVSTTSLYTGGCHAGSSLGTCSGTGVCTMNLTAGCALACVDCYVEPCEGDGACYGLPAPDGSACSDGNPCTSDACVTGLCVSVTVANGTPCGAGLTCTNGLCG